MAHQLCDNAPELLRVEGLVKGGHVVVVSILHGVLKGSVERLVVPGKRER